MDVRNIQEVNIQGADIRKLNTDSIKITKGGLVMESVPGTVLGTSYTLLYIYFKATL